MQPFLLLGSFQGVANFFGVIGLLAGGSLVYGGMKIARSEPRKAIGYVLSLLLLVPGGIILLITAALFFGDW